MGLMEEFGAWLDQKKKNVVVNAQNLPGLLSSFTRDVQQGAAADKSAFEATRSVMPGVREAGVREMNARGQELGGLLGAIKVYHGSPHKFDKFDFSKIGTGEGAQAYGHGGYFADNPEVANSYKRMAGVELRNKTGKLIDLHPDVEWVAKDLAASGGDYDKVRKSLDEHGKSYPWPAEVGKRYLGEWEKAGANAVDKGNLYEANLRWPDPAREAADPLGPQHFLDWDKPLSEQSSAVQKAVGATSKAEIKDGMPIAGGGTLRIENDPDFGAKYFLDMGGKKMRLSQSDVQNLVGTGAEGKSAYQLLKERFGTDADVSSYLNAQGIPGIRYLDGGSRGAGQGTSNYVVFDDALTEILKRNGQPLGLLAP